MNKREVADQPTAQTELDKATAKDAMKTVIANPAIFAISIDTAIFDAKQKSFENMVLRSLDQFHKRGIRVVFVDVVANEMKAHLRDDALKTKRELKKALRSHNIRWKRKDSADESASLLINADENAFARAEFDAFVEHVNGEVIKVSDVRDIVDQAFKRYFSEEPPFGPADKRKSEFPDAFALLRLEAFAAEHGGQVLCVTPDKAWVEFAARSEYLICVDNLENALARFNAADQYLAEEIVQQWRDSEGGDFLKKIVSAFEYRLETLNFYVSGFVDIPFEAEPLSATLIHVSPQSIANPTVIAGGSATVTFSVSVEALVGFEAAFHFFITDSFDGDYIDLGSEEVYAEETLAFKLTITADRSVEDGPIFHNVEVENNYFEVHLGFVEAFPNEDPTHEKY